MFLGRQNETIAESLNPPASPAASSAYKRATAVLASSFPVMGPIPIIQMGTRLALGVTGKSRAIQMGSCPLGMVGVLTVLYAAGSPTSLASQPHTATRASFKAFCSSKQRKPPPRPPTTQGSSAQFQTQEGDNNGRTDASGSQAIQDWRRAVFFSWVGRKVMIFKIIFSFAALDRGAGESMLPGRCCMICWQRRMFSDEALVKNLAANCLLDERWDASDGRQNTLSYLSEVSKYRSVTGWLSPAVHLITVYSKETRLSLSWKSRFKDCVRQNLHADGTYIGSSWSMCLAMSLPGSESLGVNMQHHVRRRHHVHVLFGTCDCTTAV